jgi:hypothetical protein
MFCSRKCAVLENVAAAFDVEPCFLARRAGRLFSLAVKSAPALPEVDMTAVSIVSPKFYYLEESRGRVNI